MAAKDTSGTTTDTTATATTAETAASAASGLDFLGVLNTLSEQNIIVNKTKISDMMLNSTTEGYSLEINYDVKTGADGNGLPSLDLSQDINLYIKAYVVVDKSLDVTLQEYNGTTKNALRTSSILTKYILDKRAYYQKEKLTYPTILPSGILNPNIRLDAGSFYYPFSLTQKVEKTDTVVLYIFKCMGKSATNIAVDRIPIIENGELKVASSKIEDFRTGYYESLFSFDVFSVNEQIKNSNISDLFASYGKNQDLKGTFFFDKRQFLIDNSVYGQILTNTQIPNNEINKIFEENSRISSLTIKRREITNILDFYKRPISAYKNQIDDIVIQTSDKPEGGGQMLKTNAVPSTIDDSTISEITELWKTFQLTGAASDTRFYKKYAFSDYDTLRGGKYQYSVSIRMQDGILIWLIDALTRLEEAQKSLKNYYEAGEYLAAASSETVQAVGEKILNILFALNPSIVNTSTSRSYFRNLLKYGSTTLELMNYNLILISKVAQMIGSAGVVSQTNSQYSKTFSKNVSDLFFLETEKEFDVSINFNDANDLTYDYLNIVKNEDVGISVVTAENFLSRCQFDFNRLIKDYITDENGQIDFSVLNVGLSRDNTNGPFTEGIEDPMVDLFDFGSNYCAFLAPKKINNTPLTKTNSFNSDTFNDLHYRNKFDAKYTPNLSISYYLQTIGIMFPAGLAREDILALKEEQNTYRNFGDVFPGNSKIDEKSEIADSYNTIIDGVSQFDEETNKYVSFINSILRQDENWDLSVQNFNISNSDSNLLAQPVEETVVERKPQGLVVAGAPASPSSEDLGETRTPRPRSPVVTVSTGGEVIPSPGQSPFLAPTDLGVTRPSGFSASDTSDPRFITATGTSAAAETTFTTEFSGITSQDVLGDPLRYEISKLPNHIRALFASKSDKVVNQWLNMVGDYFASPDNYYMIKENYMNLVKIEVLSAFEIDTSGIPNIKSPRFTKLTDEKIRNLGIGQQLFCRASLYDDQKYKIGTSFERRTYSDKYFLIKGSG